MKTPDEIKKALECCYGHAERRFCEECPLGAKVEGYSEVICTDFDSTGEGALTYIRQLETQLVNQATEYSQALKITTEQRDALKADILRATDKAHEMQSMLDNDVHPNCDYGLYCDLCDALGDVVAWEHKELLDTTPEPPEEE